MPEQDRQPNTPEVHRSDPFGQAMENVIQAGDEVNRLVVDFITNPAKFSEDIELDSMFDSQTDIMEESLYDLLTETFNDEGPEQPAIAIATILIELENKRKDYFEQFIEGFKFKREVNIGTASEEDDKANVLRNINKLLDREEDPEERINALTGRYFRGLTLDMGRLREVCQEEQEQDEDFDDESENDESREQVQEQAEESQDKDSETMSEAQGEKPVVGIGRAALQAEVQLSLTKGFHFSLRITR